MNIQSIKNVNITVLFANPINHNVISQKELVDLFKTGKQKEDLHTFIEAPGLKVLIFPNRQKELIFETNRILINEKTGNTPEKVTIINDIEKVIKELSDIKDSNIAGYGFNYNVVVDQSSNFKIEDIAGKKISSLSGIKSVGVKVGYEKNSVKYLLEINPFEVSVEKKIAVHFNVHFSQNKFPNAKELKDEIENKFNELKLLLEKL